MGNFSFYLKIRAHVKSLLRPPGTKLTSETPDGSLLDRRLITEGGSSTKSNDKTYIIAFQFLYPIFCGFNIQFYMSNT